MENSFNSYPVVQGFTAINLYLQQEFKQVGANIISQVSSLKSENKKEKFREKCKNLADYLINSKDPYRHYQEYIWKGALRTWYSKYFTGITQHGGCFMIFNNEEKELLELFYDADDFCEKKEEYMEILNNYKTNNSNIYNFNGDANCINKFTEYNVWIKGREDHFNNKKSLLRSKCENKISLSQYPTNNCDIMNSQTFKTISKFIYSDMNIPEEKVKVPEKPQRDNKDPENSIPQNEILSPVENSPSVQHSPIEISPQQGASGHTVNQDKTKENVVEASSEFESSEQTTDSNSLHTQQEDSILPSSIPKDSGAFSNPEIISPSTDSLSFTSLSLAPSTHPTSADKVVKKPNNCISSILISILTIVLFSFFIKFLLMMMFKKKRKIKRKQIKFLKLLVPSFSNKKNKLVKDKHLGYSIDEDEEIIKKIKINELTNNVNLSKRKKDRSKTIIEVHMEVLEKCINEDWENNKEEFLEICIDALVQKDYRTCANLTDDHLITENIENTNDIKSLNTLWNKWIEKYRNASEILKKEHWFHNLKNEWKQELAYIHEMEEIKKKSGEKPKVPFFEIEKYLWKQWISKNGTIIEQYLEQDWFKGLAEQLQNMSEECENEDNKNYLSPLNIEEFQQKGNYEELYKYIKKKLLTNLCVLALMTVLEECKKEVYFENRESFLDISINEWKTKKYSGNKQEITENTIEYVNSDKENKRNKEFHTHIGKDSFRNEIEVWIGEDDLYASSIVNDGTVEESIDIAEKHIS
ncbi:STP1 protein [Plasmodium malariae]|uniref:STP1 protein n=1 Tax=Plasmodium malariae TaxID=5858 RepID=A0A1D3PB72_PLAMA|nr:STP1 protein [Plasmodium malariae]SCN12446.1 STP1 protein [Plasmodium malariae]